MKKIFDRIARCIQAARHEWFFGGPCSGYLGEYSQQPFRINTFTGKEAYGRGGMKYGGMLPSLNGKDVYNAYAGEELYNDGNISFKLRKHAIDKYGRVRYFDGDLPDGYIDVMEHHRGHDSSNIINIFAKKNPQWTYAGFLEEDGQKVQPDVGEGERLTR